LPQAIEEFRKILAIDPSYFPARANLMHAYADLNRSGDAIDAAKRAITTARAAGHPETAVQFESWLENYQSQRSKAATPPGQP
jgi:tetratricopeptide (TPR) repeat protein